ncbi:MAG TPA: type II toxin-antitoxin system RelE/ParE family toxin [Candidatus Nanoarchaeia archaeon]|nr:type II toxin-antitoxin system RelE/ParE family toxin [Candidatus Nanoarchaeia archaeon]
MFELRLAPPAQKFLDKAETIVYDRIIKKLKDLANEPFPSDCKRVVNRTEKTFRVRIGGYRILYVVIHEKKEILIADIDKRPHAYD